MIRGTINEGISSIAKKTVAGVGGQPNISGGVVGEGIEWVEVNGVGQERSDYMARLAGETTLPSGAFNGTFE